MHDCHVHSIFSYDCEYTMEKMIENSIKKKYKTIYFTDNYELLKDKNLYFEFNLEEYWKEVKKNSIKYKDKIDILCGLEIGISTKEIGLLNNKINKVSLDMVVLSLHRLEGNFFNDESFLKNKNPLKIYKDYYINLFDLISNYDNFEIVGHIDILDNYIRYFSEEINFEKYSYYVKAVIKKLVEMNKGLEINTSIYNKKKNQEINQLKILQLYRKMGGEFITIGSDAKTPEEIGQGYNKAVQIAKKAGFESICIFRKRLPNFIKI